MNHLFVVFLKAMRFYHVVWNENYLIVNILLFFSSQDCFLFIIVLVFVYETFDIKTLIDCLQYFTAK